LQASFRAAGREKKKTVCCRAKVFLWGAPPLVLREVSFWHRDKTGGRVGLARGTRGAGGWAAQSEFHR